MTATAVKRRPRDPDPTVSPIPLAAGQVEAFPFTPGHCAVHPEQLLVTHTDAGLRQPSWYGDDPRMVICRDPHHAGAAGDELRCTWCGGPLVPAGTPSWRVSDRKTHCTPGCRLRAWRAERRSNS